MFALVSRFTRFVVLMIVLGTAVPGWSAVIYVRKAGNDGNNGLSWAAAKLTVQAGVNAASSGGEVWVASGTYVERITLKDGAGLYGGFAGTETQRDQRNWSTNVTILDGDAGGSVVTSPSEATATTAIDGFTIRNGTGTGAGGGGVYCAYPSSPTIANNTISGNTATNSGGAIYSSGGSPTITGNTIATNYASSTGGGIYCYYSDPTITNNTITGNIAGVGGGGIACGAASPTIANNTISGNTADGGGGVWCEGSLARIANNTISGNTADAGGGIWCEMGGPTITSNTITGNSAPPYGGGGIYCYSTSPTIANNIVAFNSSGIYRDSGTPTLRNNDVYGNTAYQYSGLLAGTGDISQDPLFVNQAGGNYHLTMSSPCINTGWDSAPGITALDMDGQPRKNGVIDIGADEYWAPPLARVYVRTTGNDANDGSSWAAAKLTVQAGLNAAASGGEVWVASGTYVERITLKDGVGLYGGFTGTETERAARNWTTNVTILDGNQGGSVVTSPSGATGTTAIDGFTIRNGTGTGVSTTDGGGIYCASGSSPAITNNTISGNSTYGGSGGAVYCGSSSSPMITNNTITGNTATVWGGGILCDSSCSAVIANNTIATNYASSQGGGIYCYYSDPTITSNTISRNTADGGGGICCAGSSSAISNNIVAFNSSGIIGSGTPALRNNDVYGNTGYNYAGISAGTGDISQDPLFVNRMVGDYHLTASSPCINAGWDSAAGITALDMDGQTRKNGVIDIGADEYWLVVIHVRTTGSDANDGLSWAAAKLTVQAGLNAASSGEEVWVASGTYVERITLKDGVGLYGGFIGSETQRDQRNWSTNVTILDGDAGGSVVTSPQDATGTMRIDGFTVRNGNSVDSGPGGGIWCQVSSPTITNNRITGNSAGFGPGGGILCSGSSPVITNNTITGNSAPNGPGGGIYCVFSSPTIANNAISANSADGGGGIYCDASPTPTITNNTISGNTATNLGGGISCTGSSPTISNNTITGNSAEAGGGIHCDYDSSPTITNNTISGNNVTGNGGGINCNLSSPAISNNIVAFNSSGISNTGGTPTLRNNDVFGNTGYSYSGLSAGVGDISQDPLFANQSGGDYHLTASSPCINAGWDSAPDIAALDMDGQTRKNGVIDIGADEHWVIHVRTTGNDANDGLSWAMAKRTVQAGVNAASSGDDVWVAGGLYVEHTNLKLGVGLYGGFAGTEAQRDQRNWVTNVTILDGNASMNVVTSPSGATGATRIDGFTIRNGYSVVGGGIYCYSSSLTITNNTITGNYAVYEGGGICSGGFGSSPTITNNTISGNSTDPDEGGMGGGIYCETASATIANNTISGNSASYGGGISCVSSSATITNNTITGNTADYGFGGGIYSEGSPTISNNIVAFNSSGLYRGDGTPTLRNNDVYGNTAYDYSGLSAGTGDISQDPLFVNLAGGNYHLTELSPCINAGWNDAPGITALDMDGQSRKNGVIDIGADEYWAPPVPPVTTIHRAKLAPDGWPVDIDGAIVSAEFADHFYIESDDRACGIRVIKYGHSLVAGMRAHVIGFVQTMFGEKCIGASTANPAGSGSVEPLGMPIKSLGGDNMLNPFVGLGQQGVMGGIGMNNIGLLVRLWGQVTEVEPGLARWFKIDDGSGREIKCMAEDGSPVISPSWQGMYAVVTGLSSCEIAGGNLVSMIRLKRDSIPLIY